MSTIPLQTSSKKFSTSAIISLLFALISLSFFYFFLNRNAPSINNFGGFFAVITTYIISILSGIYDIRAIKKKNLKGRLMAIIGITISAMGFMLALLYFLSMNLFFNGLP